MDRDGVLRLARNVPGVPYSEMVYTGLHARLLAWSEGGEHGPRQSLVWEGSDLNVLWGRLFSSPEMMITPQNDEGVWEGMG